MTVSGQQIEIPLSKRKLTLMLFGALIFVVLGILFTTNPEKYTSSIMKSTTIVFISGLVSVLFFGICFFFILRKIGDKSPGLVISDEGIFDNSSGVSGGEIKWEEIKDISVTRISGQKLIMLQLRNPQNYINKQTSSFKRKMMTINYRRYGTPVSISSNGLKISFAELLSTLKEKLAVAQK